MLKKKLFCFLCKFGLWQKQIMVIVCSWFSLARKKTAKNEWEKGWTWILIKTVVEDRLSREQTAGLSHTMKVDNSSIERLEEFKYLGTKLINQNSIQEEIKSRLKLGNACYHSVQNLLSSSLLSKNLKIKKYRTIILPVVLYGC